MLGGRTQDSRITDFSHELSTYHTCIVSILLNLLSNQAWAAIQAAATFICNLVTCI